MKRLFIIFICAAVMCLISCGDVQSTQTAAPTSAETTALTAEITTAAETEATTAAIETAAVPTFITYTKSHMGRTVCKYTVDIAGVTCTVSEPSDNDGLADTSYELDADKIPAFYSEIYGLDIMSWGEKYADPTYSGAWWNMEIHFSDGTKKALSGNILHPDGFDILLNALKNLTGDEKI